jgi:magnesium transporter
MTEAPSDRPEARPRRRRHGALKPRYNPPGTRPGNLARAGTGEGLGLWLFDFGNSGCFEARDASLELCRDYFASQNTTWVHVQGQPDAATLAALADAYGLHPLAMEDVVNLGQRPKLEPFEHELFTVVHWPRVLDGHVHMVQVSLFLGPTWLVSFCEGADDPFEAIRARLRAEPPGLIRQRGADYLLYALLDLVVDQGFPVLDHLSTELEELEDAILGRPAPELLNRTHQVKRDLILLRKGLWPQREVVSSLSREEHPLIKSRTRPYLRDCYDHSIRILDLVETYREMASGLHDLYLSSLSNRMNEVMKVLTVIATIFIPLTFVTGLYGMNFNRSASPWNMPELDWYFGYPLLLLLLTGVAVGMLIYFRRRGWL